MHCIVTTCKHQTIRDFQGPAFTKVVSNFQMKLQSKHNHSPSISVMLGNTDQASPTSHVAKRPDSIVFKGWLRHF